jgi:hypothetical protein
MADCSGRILGSSFVNGFIVCLFQSRWLGCLDCTHSEMTKPAEGSGSTDRPGGSNIYITERVHLKTVDIKIGFC